MAEVPDGPPVRFRWRRRLHDVKRVEGPERIEPEWWSDNDPGARGTRDYFRVEDTTGRRFWLYRDGLYDGAGRTEPPRWYVHGLFA
jgi:protein ImuB